MRLPLLLVFVLTVAACGPRVDLPAAVSLVDVETGWFDAGVTDDGHNKLVPSIALRIRNDSDVRLTSTQLLVQFRRVTDEEHFTESYVRGIGAGGLKPGETTPLIVARAPQGYTGLQPRMQMLSNTQFVDAEVKIFARHGSAAPVKVGEFPVTRQLLTQ